MINNVVLIGRLTKDVELRYTQGGAAVASFTLAVNRQFTNRNGEREADFINCVMWRKSAENFANFTHKGSLVGLTGRIQTRSYDNDAGTRVYVTEVVADNFSLLKPKSDHQQATPTYPNGTDVTVDDKDMPF
ncbi:single-stranded DNA-binding protein [Loigolactobacillus coryniformis]|uniref:single-stranded DNA-binding protein n=1 Tax=Loigolactobacillus coryniformis TaxID=1610 RepID=UPI003F277587